MRNNAKRVEKYSLSHLAQLYCPWGMTGNKRVSQQQAMKAFWQDCIRQGRVKCLSRYCSSGWDGIAVAGSPPQ